MLAFMLEYSANRLSCRLAAVIADAGPGSRFSANCVKLELTSYMRGRTRDGASTPPG